MDIDLSHPSIEDLRQRAKKRIPKFAFEYLDSATGREMGLKVNRDALDAIGFMPGILRGHVTAALETTLMGDTYAAPFGIAPVGMSGLIWAGAERKLAQAAVEHNIPFCLSSVAVASPEDVASSIGNNGWFQHYPVNSAELRRKMLPRIKAAGFDKLIITVDVPEESRRERQRRANLTVPPKVDVQTVSSMAMRPAWCLAHLREGIVPRMRFFDDYISQRGRESFTHAGALIRGCPDWQYLRELRQEWDGKLIVKGVQRPEDAKQLVEEGADCLWISNHSGRQFEAGPAVIDQLPKIREAVGPDMPLIYDSGVAWGLDVMRALAKGADFVMLGRAFQYGVAAFGRKGIDHVIHILRADIQSNMSQLGIEDMDQLPDLLLDS
ncbi:alpha-hydroxy acid oxidase [Shimia thalassica]|uniref:alpha-hydroxy acid oxidase n=1 Tax=Shimia thalassica TaxID=1715693 RepID=UPI001C089A76|nr:alpha-hydroxy acid oxidase [Shimia thalassica]MBU2943878.1 alpha-hydroxy-acid oxidizing protein [Shimia thalassica]MDO6505055.1 alpha-hydroxy acid oxidase [Shimia thalassica]MDP2517909.1 alpha-hydroxy acid oxidase [Shimia thalassica]